MPPTRIAVLALLPLLAGCSLLTGSSDLITGQWGGPSFRFTARGDSTVVRAGCGWWVFPGLIAPDRDGNFHVTGKTSPSFNEQGGVPIHLSGQIDASMDLMTVTYYTGVPSINPPPTITVQAVSGSTGDFSGIICVN